MGRRPDGAQDFETIMRPRQRSGPHQRRISTEKQRHTDMLEQLTVLRTNIRIRMRNAKAKRPVDYSRRATVAFRRGRYGFAHIGQRQWYVFEGVHQIADLQRAGKAQPVGRYDMGSPLQVKAASN